MEQKIVVHLKSGGIHKGVTQDFQPEEGSFHVLPAEGGGVPIRVRVEDMKALFWVRDYLGNRHFTARRGFEGAARPGRGAIAAFEDGEEIWGTLDADGGNEAEPGFYFTPADKADNNLRIYVVRSALKELRMAES